MRCWPAPNGVHASRPGASARSDIRPAATASWPWRVRRPRPTALGAALPGGVQDDPGYCSLAKGQAATKSSVMQAAAGASASAPQARIVSVPDRRIGAVVALAPMAVVFTPESLAAIKVPVRVIMAEPDACRPATGPAGRRARLRAERHPQPSPRFGARRTAANHRLAALRQGLNEPAPGARHRTAPWHGFC